MTRTTLTLWTFLFTSLISGAAIAEPLENRCPVVTENHLTNDRLIQLSQSVEPRLFQWSVRNFARAVSSERIDANDQISALVHSNGITPIDSPIAESIRKTADEDVQALSELSGLELQHAYLDRQIALLEEALARMDDRWLKMASTPDLVRYLHTARSDFTRYLEVAKLYRAEWQLLHP